jgi:hypothetical protein
MFEIAVKTVGNRTSRNQAMATEDFGSGWSVFVSGVVFISAV